MNRVRDAVAIGILIALFLLGLLGNPVGEGFIFLQIVAAVVCVVAVGWLARGARSLWRRLTRDWQAMRVSQARLQLRGQTVPETLDEAFGALRRKDWRSAAGPLWLKAETGDPVAQYYLSHLFRAGLGVPQAQHVAFLWLLHAATHGLTDAEAEVGEAYLSGYCGGTERDYAQALDWLRKAADKAHDAATINIGAMFDHGLGVDRDRAEAATWYRRAAERGDTRAQFRLGRMYLKGRGVPRDPVQAFLWMKLAAERSDSLTPEQQRTVTRQLAEAKVSMTPQESEQSRWLTNAWTDRMVKTDPEVIAKKQEAAKEKRRKLARPFVDRIRSELEKIKAEADGSVAAPSPVPALLQAPRAAQAPALAGIAPAAARPAVAAPAPAAAPRLAPAPTPAPAPTLTATVRGLGNAPPQRITLTTPQPQPQPAQPKAPPPAAPAAAMPPQALAPQAPAKSPPQSDAGAQQPAEEAEKRALAALKAEMRARREARVKATRDTVTQQAVQAAPGGPAAPPDPMRQRAEQLLTTLRRSIGGEGPAEAAAPPPAAGAADAAAQNRSARLTRTRRRGETV
ncbi:MAG: sel1 repeat family protein [Alphaproteobacteria bacterium]|nr:sel1 repeat family protein [Alphaproteobacteria bacterium]